MVASIALIKYLTTSPYIRFNLILTDNTRATDGKYRYTEIQGLLIANINNVVHKRTQYTSKNSKIS